MTTGVLHTLTATHPAPAHSWRDLIRERGYQGFIFDCDGTLVESSEAHFLSLQTAVNAQGFAFDRDWYFARTGIDRKALVAAFSETATGRFQAQEVIARSISAFIENSASVQPIACMQDLARELSKTAPLAVGTNAEKEVAEASLRATGIYEHIDFIVSISDGHAPKPAADIFSAAATRLAVPLDKILVFEDSAEGVMAAKSAGLDVIQLISA